MRLMTSHHGAGESINLAAQNPAVLKRLTAQLAAWTATLPTVYEKGDEKDE